MNTRQVYAALESAKAEANSLFNLLDIDFNEAILESYDQDVPYDQEEYEEETPAFIRLIYSPGESGPDHDNLPFIIELFEDNFVLTLDTETMLYRHYDDFSSPKNLVHQLKLLVHALLVSRIIVLKSYDKEKVYARETVVFPGDTDPVVVNTDAVFPIFKQQGDSLKAACNVTDLDQLDLPKDFFLLVSQTDNSYKSAGRSLGQVFLPVTRRELTAVGAERLTSGPADNDAIELTYAAWSWQLWLLALAIFVVGDYAVTGFWEIIYYPLSGISLLFLAGYWVSRENPRQPLLYRVHHRLPQWARIHDITIVYALAIGATFWLKDSYRVNTELPVSFMQLATERPVFYIPIVLTLLYIILAQATARKRLPLIKLLVFIAVIATYFAVQPGIIDINNYPNSLVASLSGILGSIGLVFTMNVLLYRLFNHRRYHIQL